MTAAPEQTTPAAHSGHSRRVLLKLSGEVFGGGKIGLAPDVVRAVARQIAQSVREGIEV
ncbi:MAG TPA: UMP kinase, partial [Pedococcus sp.]|nr:UMP kinase [Pedococcus sp.]